MKILLLSHTFFPNTGGLETISEVLAKEFVRQGHQVVVVTQTPEELGTHQNFPFRIYRQPKHRQLLRLARWCDVYFQNNISLQTLWPLLLVRRPWVVAHHTWIARVTGSLGIQDRLKLGVLRFGKNISISQAIADTVPAPSTIVGNSYNDSLFRVLPDATRNKDLIFLGRLVSDKGCDLAIEALAKLKERGVTPELTIVGTGPDEAALKQQVEEGKLESQVAFTGLKKGEELVRLLNEHKIMVVPSQWNEPFGIVALEGIACGCVVVGADGGGLPEAIGPCGVTFTRGNVDALQECLERLLVNPTEVLPHYTHQADEHLAKFTSELVGRAYLQVFEQSLARRKRRL